MLAGLFWIDRAGRWLHRAIPRAVRLRLALRRRRDAPAARLDAASLRTVLAPVVLAYSRYQEHEADRFALDLTHMNHSAARAFADLQRENLGVPRPGLVYTIWRGSHPSIAERIEFCNTYRPWEKAETPRPAGN